MKKSQRTEEIMRSIRHWILGIAVLGIHLIATAQTDNGGGMGGTGINDKSAPVSPAMSEEACSREKSVGIYQTVSNKDGKIKKQGYVCVGQLFKTKFEEEINIHFRSGHKIKILENSQIFIDRPDL